MDSTINCTLMNRPWLLSFFKPLTSYHKRSNCFTERICKSVLLFFLNADLEHMRYWSEDFVFWVRKQICRTKLPRSVKGIAHVFKKKLHEFSHKPQVAGRKPKYRHLQDFSPHRICVKNDSCLKLNNLSRRNNLVEQVRKLMTCTQMIATTEFVSRP